MKKGFILMPLLAVILTLGLIMTSCGGNTTSTQVPQTSAPPNTVTTTQPSSSITAQPSSTPTANLSTIKVGHILDLTGPEAMVGQEEETALQLAFDDANDQIAGHPVQVIIGDAQGSPATAIDVARKMVEEDKVAAIFGPTQIGEKNAVAGYIAQAGIPLITYNPTPLSLFQGSTANKWVIGASGSDVQEPTCMADYLYNHLHYKTIDTLTQDNSAGRSFLNPLIDDFKADGGQVAQSQWVPVPCPDFSTYLVNLKPADALVAWDSGSDAILLLTQYQQLGINKKLPLVGAFHGGFLDSFIIAALPPDAAAAAIGNITIMSYAPDSQSPANQAFAKSYTAKVGYPPGDDGAAGPYQAAMIFMQAVKSTNGDTTPDTLLSALSKVNITGPEGPVSFAPGTTCATMNMYILKVAQFAPNVFGYSTVYTYNDVPPSGYAAK